MSQNIQKIKRDVLREIEALPFVSADAWAEILLKHSQYCTTIEDQKDFWCFLLNPYESRDFQDPVFTTVPDEPTVDINTGFEYDNQYYTSDLKLEGGTLFIDSKPYTIAQCDQEDEKIDDEKVPEIS